MMRSLDADLQVLGWVAASPKNILERIEGEPDEDERQRLRHIFKGIDGRDVKEPWILPTRPVSPPAKRGLGLGTSVRRDIIFERDAPVYTGTCPDDVRYHTCSKNQPCTHSGCKCEKEPSEATGRCK